MIKNILFDLGGVLIDLDVQRSLEAFAAMVGNNGNSGPVTEQGLLGGHDSRLIDLYQTGDITTDEFIRSILSICRPGTTEADVVDAWFAMLLGIREDRKQLLMDLAAHGYNIYVLSNINELHVDWVMANCPELKQAKHLFFSNEMHLSKPDPRCYEVVLRETGILPQETVYIDDLVANIEEGKNHGFNTIRAVNDEWIPKLREICML